MLESKFKFNMVALLLIYLYHKRCKTVIVFLCTPWSSCKGNKDTIYNEGNIEIAVNGLLPQVIKPVKGVMYLFNVVKINLSGRNRFLIHVKASSLSIFFHFKSEMVLKFKHQLALGCQNNWNKVVLWYLVLFASTFFSTDQGRFYCNSVHSPLRNPSSGELRAACIKCVFICRQTVKCVQRCLSTYKINNESYNKSERMRIKKRSADNLFQGYHSLKVTIVPIKW